MDSGLTNVDGSFSSYVSQLGQSVNNAQAVPAQIDSFIKSNQAGLQLLESAWQFEGKVYGDGMTCDQLVAHATGALGFSVPTYPWCKDCKTVTDGWFRYGMGRLYPQILGGESGITLRQLADDYMADDHMPNKVNIPIGALIVADGHAALFEGVAKVGALMELITYDANKSTGWTVSVLTGERSPGTAGADDYGVIQLTFGDHQVGQHVTRLQWVDPTIVKVYKFIGNPTLHVEEPNAVLQKLREATCRADVDLAIQSRSTACSTGSPQSYCDAARIKADQATSRCATPLKENPILP